MGRHRLARRPLFGQVRAYVAAAAAFLALSVAALPAQPALGLGNVQVLAPTVTVRAWTVENGLPQSAVTELTRDSSGFVWGGTFGGLFRFDGRTIRRYTSSDLPALTGNSVTALSTDVEGTMLVGTPGGSLIRLRDGQLVDTIALPPLSANAVTIDEIMADRPGEVWIRRAEWVQRLVGGRWSTPIPHKGGTDLVRSPDGHVWFAGPGGIVRVAPDGTARVVSREPHLDMGQQYGIHLDRWGRLWVGGQNGLWVYEPGKGARKIADVRGRVSIVTTDSSGTVWFGAGERLYRASVTTLTAGSPPAVLDARAKLISIESTRDGLLLLGTVEGLLLVRSSSIRVVVSRRVMPAVESGSIAGNGDGTIWVTSACSDLLRMDRTTLPVDSMRRPNPRGCTRSVRYDRLGRLWVGGDGAIRRRDADRRERVWNVDRLELGLALVRPLLPDGDSLLFGLSDGRVGVIDREDRVRFLDGWRARTDRPVESMMIGADRALWVAQAGRLTRVAGGSTRTFAGAHGIPGAVPRALYGDSTGAVWIGTYGAGLWHFRAGGRARPVPVADQTVSAIIEGPNGRLWMPGNRGISVVGLRNLAQWVGDSTVNPDVRLLSFEEGVPEGNVGFPAATRLAPGILAFASVAGLVVAHTDGVVTGGVTPPLVVDAVRSSAGPLARENGQYQVTPDHRAVYVTVSMPSFRFADAASFRYRLGDGGWVALSDERELRLTLSEPGLNVLTVEGRVPGGDWSRAAPVQLYVVPRFAERLWPRLALVVVLLALVGAVGRQRLRATEAIVHARDVELKARRDAAELAERHHREMAQVGRVAVAGELTASLSHELGQPLAAIVNNAEVARRLLSRSARPGEPPNAAVEQALLDVVAQGRRASQVVREFRRFLKREHGERELVRVQELLDDVTLLLRQEYAQCGVRLTVQVVPHTPALFVERVLVQQVLVNLLQNSCEAARRVRGGAVLVRARPVDDGARLTVVDNGPGFPADIRRAAFEPFVTTRSDGMGMGLAIARRVVESHGGHIAVGRLPSAGAVVSLWLPARHVPADASDGLVPSQVTTHA